MHPREKIDKYSDLIKKFDIKIINDIKASESINFFKYNYIINFFSSAVIDMIDRNYPPKRIISILPKKSSEKLKHVFSDTLIIENIGDVGHYI